MRDVELYRHLLGLESPWTVRSVELKRPGATCRRVGGAPRRDPLAPRPATRPWRSFARWPFRDWTRSHPKASSGFSRRLWTQ